MTWLEEAKKRRDMLEESFTDQGDEPLGVVVNEDYPHALELVEEAEKIINAYTDEDSTWWPCLRGLAWLRKLRGEEKDG